MHTYLIFKCTTITRGHTYVCVFRNFTHFTFFSLFARRVHNENIKAANGRKVLLNEKM